MHPEAKYNFARDQIAELQQTERNRIALFGDKFKKHINIQKALKLNEITDS